MKLGVIADDFTGATDIAGFLVENGLSTLQLAGVPEHDGDLPPVDAVVISLKSRSCPADEAVRDSLAALDWLKARGCPRIYQKYCSTFDSTAAGNIGPVTDALLAALESKFTLICPALPVNGRTVYQGNLFVGTQPLAESGMRHHPITPMTDSNLLRLMEGQAQGRAGLVPFNTIAQGPAAIADAFEQLTQAGVRYAVVDTLTEQHLLDIATAALDMPLVTGGSGLAIGLARQLGSGDLQGAREAGWPRGTRAAVLSGSCSEMTNRQVARYRQHAPALALDVVCCNLLLKPLVARVRPFDANPLVELIVGRPTDWSFPSGHTAASFASTAALYASGEPLWIPAAVLSVLIAFSRLYLYVHYPTDVLAGLVLGTVLGVLGRKLFLFLERKVGRKAS